MLAELRNDEAVNGRTEREGLPAHILVVVTFKLRAEQVEMRGRHIGRAKCAAGILQEKRVATVRF